MLFLKPIMYILISLKNICNKFLKNLLFFKFSSIFNKIIFIIIFKLSKFEIKNLLKTFILINFLFQIYVYNLILIFILFLLCFQIFCYFIIKYCYLIIKYLISN